MSTQFYKPTNVIRNGKTLMKLAKLAPAPNMTNIAGRAQQKSVDDDVNNEKILTKLSFIIT
ncbi:MAG: hypothetical protein CM15mP58_13910 [Burkholderiaceae bacterium]|nr:MAG: hypothetical protein CM15mP58_13910 [Burkholderiaceae bacterium]